MIHENIYKKLIKLFPDLERIREHRKLQASGFMDLHLDMLFREKGAITLALSHYYKHDCGDMIADPDMTLRVYPQQGMAEALTYQDAFGYQEVYPEEGKVNLAAKKTQNAFLSQWLSNLLEQGHC